jgi:hypothetical protein
MNQIFMKNLLIVVQTWFISLYRLKTVQGSIGE